MSYKADARTNALGRAVSNSSFGTETDLCDCTLSAKAEVRTQRTDEHIKRMNTTLWSALDSFTLPNDASVCASFILASGGHPTDEVTIDIYQKYVIDSKSHERKPTRGRRSVFTHKNVQYQSIGGHVFVGDGMIKNDYGR